MPPGAISASKLLRIKLKVLLASSRSRRQLRGRSAFTQGEAVAAASDAADAMASEAAATAVASDEEARPKGAGGVSPALQLLGPALRPGATREPQRVASFSRLIARLLVSVIKP